MIQKEWNNNYNRQRELIKLDKQQKQSTIFNSSAHIEINKKWDKWQEWNKSVNNRITAVLFYHDKIIAWKKTCRQWKKKSVTSGLLNNTNDSNDFSSFLLLVST